MWVAIVLTNTGSVGKELVRDNQLELVRDKRSNK
jgi:hypothetical protein